MSTLFLARARLRRDGAVAALARLLVPTEENSRTAAAHRLVWALFAGDPAAPRDFLWREEAPGHFLALSPRPPADPDRLFDLEVKEFAPALASGDRLGFALRANPVISRSTGPGQRGQRHDVVMDALRAIPKPERASRRLEVAAQAARAWLTRQGATGGFTPLGEPGVDGYETLRLPRDGSRPMQFSRLDIEGVLRVDDPDVFVRRLAQGFGRSRAFGCGLMLVRRAR